MNSMSKKETAEKLRDSVVYHADKELRPLNKLEIDIFEVCQAYLTLVKEVEEAKIFL